MKHAADFRVGHVFKRTCSVLARNFLKLGVVAGIAGLPLLLILLTLAPDAIGPLIDLHLPLIALVRWLGRRLTRIYDSGYLGN